MTPTADRVAAGREALRVPLTRPDGATVTLESYLADPLLVFTWASW